MVEKIAENVVLDFVTFQVSRSENSYEALICSNGVIEKLDGGHLDRLAMHLPEAHASLSDQSYGSFKLQLDASIEASSWFTKFTLSRFLHVVNVPNVLKIAGAIENEIRQLEETRRFQIALYAKDNSNHFGGGATEASYLNNDAGLTQQIKVETASSDATKNDLLRAMDLRLTALKEELVASFNGAAGAVCCTNQISDLASFAQHFGAVELSNLLLKFLELYPNNLHSDTEKKQQASLNDSGSLNQPATGRFSLLGSKPDVTKPLIAGVSPAKVAQAERQNSSESGDSSDSSDRDNPPGERSRPVVRSTAPRRSASPMRRIQIGRSGSRRPAAIAIKSLNYFPDREKTVSNRDSDPTETFDDEMEHLPKKPEVNVTRMSVQDAISLFESKQKDEQADIQNRKTSESSVSANKSVLRRWSAGMGGSFNYSMQEKTSDSSAQIVPSNLEQEAEKKDDVKEKSSTNPENFEVLMSEEIIREEPLQGDAPTEPVVTSNVIDGKDRTSTEWRQQQEAELNEMLTKMTESSKLSKHPALKVGNDGLSDTSIDQRGGFYSQYKEKRDEKLRAENARNHAAKQAQFKVMHEALEQSKAAMASKTMKSVVKPESTNLSQKPRRNSSPPVLSKKELSKPTSTKNVLPKLSSPKTGSAAMPSGPLKRKGGTPPAKSPPVVSSSSMPSRRKPQPLNSPRQPSPRSEKLPGSVKGSSVQTLPKPSLKGKEDKQLKVAAKNNKSVKSRSPLSGEDCGELSKPAVPNKYTKKSSVVPLESKPFLRKSTGISKAKDARVEKLGDSSKNSGNLIQPEETESNATLAVSTKVIEDDLLQPQTVVDETLAAPLDNDMYVETTENVDGSITGSDNEIENTVVPMIAEVERDEDLGISSAAWVEIEHHDYSPSSNNGLRGASSPVIVPAVSSSSRVRHSLSQMLQAESGEPEIIEWGNAENPPSLVYQKDAPKGLKRLLKFARKSKGEGNSTGWSSPSVFSDGEEEHEESKTASRTSEALLRKASLQTKGCGQPGSMVNEGVDGGNSSKRAIDYRIVHDVSSGSSAFDKPRGGHISTGMAAATKTTTTKASRSFFSLSSFRSSKSNTKKT